MHHFNDEELYELHSMVEALDIHELRELIARKKGALGALTGKRKVDSLDVAYDWCLKVAAALLGQIVIDTHMNVSDYEVVKQGYARLSQVRDEVFDNVPKLHI